jgi:hypothetical protein
MVEWAWNRIQSSLFAGILVALAGALLGTAVTEDIQLSAVALFVSWTVTWWLVIPSPEDLRLRRGALAGGIATILTFLTYMVTVAVYSGLIGGLSPVSLPNLSLLLVALFVIGILLFGGLTVPIGAGVGVSIVYVQSKLVSPIS